MNANELDRMKSLLGVMVRRHSRHDGSAGASHPVGALIARETARLEANGAYDDTNSPLVEHLYRRLLAPRHSTVALADSPSVTLEEVYS